MLAITRPALRLLRITRTRPAWQMTFSRLWQQREHLRRPWRAPDLHHEGSRGQGRRELSLAVDNAGWTVLITARRLGAVRPSASGQPWFRPRSRGSRNVRGSCRRRNSGPSARSAFPSCACPRAQLFGNDSHWHTPHRERRTASVAKHMESDRRLYSCPHASVGGRPKLRLAPTPAIETDMDCVAGELAGHEA